MANESETRAVATAAPARQIQRVENVQPMLDSDRFEHFQRASRALMNSSILNPSIRGNSPEQCFSNLMLVFDLSDRWKLPAISIAQGISIVHDKVVYEGKLIAAMLDASLGVTLYPWWQGERGALDYRIFISDVPWDDLTDEQLADLRPGAQIRGRRIVDGSVGEWRTFQRDGRTPNPAWTGAATQNQTLYRGSREWARRFEPAQMLGVYGDDEIEQIEVRMVQARERATTPGLTGFTRPAEAQVEPAADAIEDAVVEEVDAKVDEKPQEQAQEAQVEAAATDGKAEGEKPVRGKRSAKEKNLPTEDALNLARGRGLFLASMGQTLDVEGQEMNRDISAAFLEGAAEGEAILAADVEQSYQRGLEGLVMTQLKPGLPDVEDYDLLLKRWEILREAWERGQAQAKADAAGDADPVDDDLGDGDDGPEDFVEDDEPEFAEVGEEGDAMSPIDAWIFGLEELHEWSAIKSSLNGFIKTADWNAASAEDQARIRAAAWAREAKLINAGKDRLDFINDLTAFRCWIETTTDADAIQGNWMTLVRQPIYEGLTHEQKQGLEKATMNRVRIIQGAAAV